MIFFKLLKKVLHNFKNINLKDTIDVIKNKRLLVYWSHNLETKNNFGDILNIYLLKIIFKKDVVHSSKVINIFLRPKIYFIGSILNNFRTFNSIVIGSGFMSENTKIYIKPKKIFAVRGPLSREIFLKHNIECPKVYCDPALLLPEFIKVNNHKYYDIGIIPHYVDKNICSNINIINKNNYIVNIIDIESDYINVIEEINKCRYILSSSLHGIVVAHAYNVPASWIEFSSNVSGVGFKFRDYYLSVGETNIVSFKITDNNLDLEEALLNSKSYSIEKNILMLKNEISKFKELYEI